MSPLFCDRGGQRTDRGIGYSRKLDYISKHIFEYRGSNKDTIFKNFPETGDCFVKSKIKQ